MYGRIVGAATKCPLPFVWHRQQRYNAGPEATSAVYFISYPGSSFHLYLRSLWTLSAVAAVLKSFTICRRFPEQQAAVDYTKIGKRFNRSSLLFLTQMIKII